MVSIVTTLKMFLNRIMILNRICRMLLLMKMMKMTKMRMRICLVMMIIINTCINEKIDLTLYISKLSKINLNKIIIFTLLNKIYFLVLLKLL